MAADDGTMRGVSNPSGAGKAASTVTNAVVIASPMPPLRAVRNAPSTKNWVKMARCVAPSALRSPISRVRSVTETSMMLMMPMAPSASVITPTTPRNQSMPLKILSTRLLSSIVSQSSNDSVSFGSKPWPRFGVVLVVEPAPRADRNIADLVVFRCDSENLAVGGTIIADGPNVLAVEHRRDMLERAGLTANGDVILIREMVSAARLRAAFDGGNTAWEGEHDVLAKIL